MRKWKKSWALGLLLLPGLCHAADGKLLATPGVSQVEGSAGGGLVPWAMLAGYASRDEVSASAFATRVSVDDYRLEVWGAAFNWQDRVELSAAHQNFTLKQSGDEIRQNVYGLKVRLYGDVVYSTWPQLSLGLQHKRLKDPAIAEAVGADRTDHDTEFYLAASKLHLGALAGYNLLWNVTLRSSRSNQLGLLGYGGDEESSRELLGEASLAVLLHRQWALGYEYRMKPDNLGFAEEDDWSDFFIAYFPSKSFNVTAAYADLGSIAGEDDQKGLYLSMTGYLW